MAGFCSSHRIIGGLACRPYAIRSTETQEMAGEACRPQWDVSVLRGVLTLSTGRTKWQIDGPARQRRFLLLDDPEAWRTRSITPQLG